jgi:ATP-dependent Clp protease, protease subunit
MNISDPSIQQLFLPSFNSVRNHNLDRLIYVQGEFDEQLAKNVITNLFELSAKDTKTPIVMAIDSFGGEVYSALPIVDIIDALPNKLYTFVLGKAMSAAAILAICGTTGCRYMLKNSSYMLHQISYIDAGTVDHMRIAHEEAKKLQQIFNKIVLTRTMIEKEDIKKFVSTHDSYFYASTAIKYGLCDHVINKRNIKQIFSIIKVNEEDEGGFNAKSEDTYEICYKPE